MERISRCYTICLVQILGVNHLTHTITELRTLTGLNISPQVLTSSYSSTQRRNTEKETGEVYFNVVSFILKKKNLNNYMFFKTYILFTKKHIK